MAGQLDDFEALLAKQEKRIRDAFMSFIRSTNDPVVIAEIQRLIEAGRIDDALAILDRHYRVVTTAFSDAFADSGRAAMAGFASGLADPVVAVFFDPSDPAAAAKIQRQTMLQIRQFSSDQRAAVRQAMQRGYETGAGYAPMARAFRSVIGLTAYQESHVASYRRALESQSRNALDRALRDRRFDASVRRATSKGGDPLTPEQIDRMTDRYRQRYLIHRSENIARTQGLAATSMARDDAARQMMTQLGLGADRIEREWFRTADKRTRDWHDTMHGQIRGMDQPFVDGKSQLLMYPGDPSAKADTIINCRCAVVYRIKP
jgi:uncharacterized protein with gpF-like domain